MQVFSSVHRTDASSLSFCSFFFFFRESADTAVLAVDLFKLPKLKNEGCVCFKILQLTEKSLSWQIALIWNLHSAAAPADSTWQALWQWLQSLMITAGLLSALQQRAASRSLFKLVKHARSFTPIALLFSNFSGEKSFLHFCYYPPNVLIQWQNFSRQRNKCGSFNFSPFTTRITSILSTNIYYFA